jgi:hypothetical protein
MTKRRRHMPDQIIRKLAEGNKLLDCGAELDEVCPPTASSAGASSPRPGPPDTNQHSHGPDHSTGTPNRNGPGERERHPPRPAALAADVPTRALSGSAPTM